MSRKTLIVNASPRVNGDTATLVAELRRTLQGEVVELSAYRAHIAPCVDCRRCWTTAQCAVEDDMRVIYSDDFDNVVLATPVYYCTLPGPMLSLMSRFQPQHAATFFLKKPIKLKPKKAGLILVAGGKGNEAEATHHIRVFFKMLNANGYEDHAVLSARTDTIPAAQDASALRDVHHLASWLAEA
ncbi:MAG: NAD(P)H-dependent oxidoreductase [Oscillospiraceae bacterium]|nr:NAD(P)H-dependent oxidoreductase [Oscillospiraceae bacterium]